MDVARFAGTSPEFLPEQFFAGELEGWGIVERVTGGLMKRFTVRARGSWDAGAAVVSFDETWRFDDGRSETLSWRIARRAAGHYTGSEPRLRGEATGRQAGAAFHWRYRRDTPIGDGRSFVLNFDDWFYRLDERVGMVRGSAGRAGLPFVLVHATYRRLGA